MSRGPSTHGLSAFDGFRAGRFFYSNLRIQEALTTIRYGIEARKGWVVITGDAGVGKTTLLYKAAADLSPNVTCIVESDPRVSFVEVLQLILRSLSVDNAGADERAMTQSCQRELRARLQKSQLVALMFDNAHHLSEQTLRQVIKSFCAGSAEDPEGTLVQLVLAGRPELQTKLSQAALLPLRRRTPIVCEILPLSSREIGPYIEHALRANGQPAELFDGRAIKRIALYTRGNPRAINALCEHATRGIGEAAGASVSAEVIDEVARDLNLLPMAVSDEPPRVTRSFAEDLASPPENGFTRSQFAPRERPAPSKGPAPTERPVPPESSPPWERPAPSGDYTKVLDAVGHTFVDYRKWDEDRGASARVKRKRTWVSLMVFAILLSGAAGWLGTGGARDSMGGWAAVLNGFIAYLQEARNIIGNTETTPKPSAERDAPESGSSPLEAPSPESVPANTAIETPAGSAPGSARSNNGRETASPGAARPRPQVASPANEEQSALPRPITDERPNQDLQREIIKAIENRAIMGVAVSVVGRTAYLDGRVATERQRRAAERAAHSVAGVLSVRNRIAVSPVIQSAVERAKARTEKPQLSKREALSAGSGEGEGAAAIGPGGRGGPGIVKGIDFIAYQNRMLATIKENWAWVGQRSNLSVVVHFGIRENGEIFGLRIIQPSGDPSYDESVLRAVKKSSPLSAPPEDYRRDFADVQLTFRPRDLGA